MGKCSVYPRYSWDLLRHQRLGKNVHLCKDRRLGYNVFYNMVYDLGYDPNIKIVTDGFTKTMLIMKGMPTVHTRRLETVKWRFSAKLQQVVEQKRSRRYHLPKRNENFCSLVVD